MAWEWFQVGVRADPGDRLAVGPGLTGVGGLLNVCPQIDDRRSISP